MSFVLADDREGADAVRRHPLQELPVLLLQGEAGEKRLLCFVLFLFETQALLNRSVAAKQELARGPLAKFE